MSWTLGRLYCVIKRYARKKDMVSVLIGDSNIPFQNTTVHPRRYSTTYLRSGVEILVRSTV